MSDEARRAAVAFAVVAAATVAGPVFCALLWALCGVAARLVAP